MLQWLLPNRIEELDAIHEVYEQVNPLHRIIPPDEVHVEGGDVMPWNDYIFVGTYSGDDYSDYITARTNMDAVIALQELFPDKIVKSFENASETFFYTSFHVPNVFKAKFCPSNIPTKTKKYFPFLIPSI